jgi:hypothetical protein
MLIEGHGGLVLGVDDQGAAEAPASSTVTKQLLTSLHQRSPDDARDGRVTER